MTNLGRRHQSSRIPHIMQRDDLAGLASGLDETCVVFVTLQL